MRQTLDQLAANDSVKEAQEEFIVEAEMEGARALEEDNQEMNHQPRKRERQDLG